MMSRYSKNSQVYKKGSLVESLLYKRAWNFTDKRTLPSVSYLGKLLKIDDFCQLILNSLGRLFLTYFNFWSQQFFSAVIFYNVTLNVNKTFLLIALLEPTPYRINMPVSFLEYLIQIIFNDSLKQNEQLASTVD